MVIICNTLQTVKGKTTLVKQVSLNSSIIPVMKFTEWLTLEMEKKNWNKADLARHINFTESAISLLFNGKRQPGIKMCQVIAEALELPPDLVFRQAGILPALEDEPPELAEMKYWFLQMTADEREEHLAMGRFRVQQRNKRQKKKPTTQPRGATL